MEHEFTAEIRTVLQAEYGYVGNCLLERSPLLQYLNLKTRSASRGAKARSSFANLFAVYVLVEDYRAHSFDQRHDYRDYEGARFTDLLHRQRQLPFGSKLQNHALNSRMNDEFKKFFPQIEATPILRDRHSNRYWINEALLEVECEGQVVNIAQAILAIIDRYIAVKRSAFLSFIETTEHLQEAAAESDETVFDFILRLLAPHVDARLFEIVSYSILRAHYGGQVVYFGFDAQHLRQEALRLYKTGRTNANDGGIDFVMRPLGRFFQVSETTDVSKYLLDIEKVEHFPITFVIKSEESSDALFARLRDSAEKRYRVKAVVQRYMDSIEEVINLPILRERFRAEVSHGHLREVLSEIIRQSKIEFNIDD